MATPPVHHRTCALPRAGGEAGDYEDAAAVRTSAWPVCAAVADGATESVFAREWARILANGVTSARATTAERLQDALVGWRADWRDGIEGGAAERPWYVTAKAAEGAFATVLGLSLHADGRWRAVSVGDCCLFQVRDGALMHSWPVESPDAFTNRPALVSSRSPQVPLDPEATEGTWRAGDRFLLATDAVAAWLLGTDPAAVAALDEPAVQERLAAARADDTLRNDDATLLVLTVDAEPEGDPPVPDAP